MRYLSVCSGIEAATVAWHPLGWEPAAFSEIEAFPRAVLSHHYPDVPLHGDFTTIKGGEYGAVQLLVGGTPCQSFSVAGLRKGMDDPRGNLALGYLGLAERLGARWLVWENVPGVLSSNGGRDFGAFLGGLAELGYGWAYRVLDAQYFGVPQRRRRVFVVGYLGDWRRAAAVLFERHSLQGHSPPSREARKRTAGSAGSCAAGGGWPAEVAPTLGSHWADRAPGNNQDMISQQGGLFVPDVAWTLTSREAKGPSSDCDSGTLIAHTLRADGFDASEDGTGRGTPLVPIWSVTQDSCPVAMEEQSPALKVGTGLEMGQPPCVMAFAENSRSEIRLEGGDGQRTGALTIGGGKPGQGVPTIAFNSDQSEKTRSMGEREESCPTLRAGGAVSVARGMAVRRITPREAERLQGFPDDYTLIPRYAKPRGKDLEEMARYCGFPSVADFIAYGPPADGPRYKALGNSMAVPVMAWIGERIALVDALAESEREEAA